MVEKIFLIVLCHAVGDYLFQTDFLAKTKGTNWYHLFLHCMMYAVPFYLVFGWCWQLALVTIAHSPIDAMKARWGQDYILARPGDSLSFSNEFSNLKEG